MLQIKDETLAVKVTIIRLFFFVIPILLFVNSIDTDLFAQVVPENPIYNQSYRHFQHGLPVFEKEHQINGGINYSSYTGVKNIIKTFYGGFFYQSFLKKNSIVVGINFTDHAFGEYLNFNEWKAYFLYHFRISEHLYLKPSLGFGISSFGFKTIQVQGLPDLNAGLGIVYKTFELAGSYEHILPLKFKPLTSEINFPSRMNIYAGYVYEGLWFKNHTNVVLNIFNSIKYTRVNIGNEIYFKDLVYVGVRLINLESIGYGAGLKWTKGRHVIFGNFMFYSELQKSTFNTNKYEISIFYSLKKKEIAKEVNENEYSE